MKRCGPAADWLPAFGVQNGESRNAPIIPKAYGALNLGALSDSLPHLEQFVIFSSVVSSTGNEGEPVENSPLSRGASCANALTNPV